MLARSGSLLAALALALAGCQLIGDEEAAARYDLDDDGYAWPDDCDDADPAVNPGATEVCDSVDQDCDGVADDGAAAATFYRDADGDGFGDAASFVEACAAPEGYVADATDCDDGNEGRHPGAAETCDGTDQDCDDLVDDDDPDVVGATTWYPDADGDTWGADTGAVTSCEAPADHVALSGDCDDADPAFHPGAIEDDCADPNDYNCDGSAGGEDGDGDGWAACEECDDGNDAVNPDAAESCNGIDDDCDGTIDVGAVDGDTWYADADGDGHGDADVTTTDCTAPEGYVGLDDDCDDGDDQIAPGADEHCDDVDEDCDGAVDEDAVDPATWYHDADGDGFGDPAVTATGCTAPSDYVADATDCDDTDPLVNPPAGNCERVITGGTYSASTAGAKWTGEAAADHAGRALAARDGRAAIGAPQRASVGTNAGSVYLVSGIAGGTLSGADGVLSGEVAQDFAGWSVAAGDANGDGETDWLVGARDEASAGNDRGAAYLVLGPVLGNRSLGAAEAKLRGEADRDHAGAAVAFADVDGDGNDDVIVGAPDNDAAGNTAGAAYVILSATATGTVGLASADAILLGDNVRDAAGTAVAGVGDVDGDGLGDLLVGATGADAGGTDSGAAYLVLGTPSGTVDLGSADAILHGAAGDLAGTALAGGDADGDGRADLLIGGPGNGAGAGAAWLVLGVPTGTVALSTADAVLTGEAAGDAAGTAVGFADVEGNGAADLLIGGPGHDSGAADAGIAWLVLGSGASGTVALSGADVRLVGDGAGAGFGGSVAGADMDGDGYEDPLVGGHLDDEAGADAGAVWWFDATGL